MISLRIGALQERYRAGSLQPADLVGEILQRIRARGNDNVWITLRDEADIRRDATALQDRDPAGLPLYGIPFAVKDNIDAEGMPTTAACPGADLQSGDDAEVVRRLRAAGALLIGKTNMDQFATGLVGTRSPFGVPRNPFNADYIPGGSSSGSAVAVSSGLVSFALGTDTAGSGRVPAAFNNIVGLKPTRGLVSNRGVFPACRSLDCVSIFALTAADAGTVLTNAGGYDPEDPYARRTTVPERLPRRTGLRFGVPRPEQLEFFGDDHGLKAYEAAVERLKATGANAVTIDLQPFREAAALLYEGPWVAERLAVLETFAEERTDDLQPSLLTILERARQYDAADAFRAQHRLAELSRAIEGLWTDLDCLLLPTAPTIYRIEDIEREPIRLNSNLGYYTNFVNLLDLAAVAVPAGFRPDGLPTGVTLIGPAWSDADLADYAAVFHAGQDITLGATEEPVPAPDEADGSSTALARVAVVGAHLTGQPLNHQLTERGGRLVRSCRTAPSYRLFALAGTQPAKPGLLRDTDNGAAIEVEVWELPVSGFGAFVALIPPPLGIGSLELEDGSYVQGFICEPWALEQAEEITQLGGWRAYVGQAAGS